MGKGARAHFQFESLPLSSADLSRADKVELGPHSLYNAQSPEPKIDHDELIEEAPMFILLTTYMSYLLLIVVGHIRDFIDGLLYPEKFHHLKAQNGIASLNTGFDTFYHRRLYGRIADCFERPITGVPGRTLTMLEREKDEEGVVTRSLTGNSETLLNLSSYNYLGFAQSEGPCADSVEESLRKHGVSLGSSRMEGGTHALHVETEKLVARFLGQESAVIVSMGFATNSTTLPALVSKGSLIISDELNHSSLVFGARLSGATIKVFKHNDAEALEKVLREAIAQGQPRTHRPWKKILLVVEGLYSMEGNICCLPEILALKKKYNFYLYLDEAHSIGALGPNGRGVCDYYGVDPCEVDVLMGTFTKSFGAAGGYIAGRKEIMDSIRLRCHSSIYAEPISLPVVQQLNTSMRIIMGEICGDDGRLRIQTLAKNSQYFASELRRLGFIVYGSDSPVIPLLLCNPAKIAAFSREMLERKIAVVVVGYPATPIITSRVRFCISAAHTEEDLKFALEQISKVGDRLCLKFGVAAKAMKTRT